MRGYYEIGKYIPRRELERVLSAIRRAAQSDVQAGNRRAAAPPKQRGNHAQPRPRG